MNRLSQITDLSIFHSVDQVKKWLKTNNWVVASELFALPEAEAIAMANHLYTIFCTVHKFQLPTVEEMPQLRRFLVVGKH